MATVDPPVDDRLPGVVAGSFWAPFLEIAGLILFTGAFGYAVLTLNAYEERFGPLSNPPPTSGSTPAEATANPIPAPSSASEPMASLTAERDQARTEMAAADSRAENLQHDVDALNQRLTAEQEKNAAELSGAVGEANSKATQCSGELEKMRFNFLELRKRYSAAEAAAKACTPVG